MNNTHPITGWCPEDEFPEQLNAFLATAPVGNYPWDETDKPPVILWSDFEPIVAERAQYRDQQRKAGICSWPWIIAQELGIPWTDPDQGQLGTCAGFASDTASWCMLLQHLADGIELEFVATNPYPAWVLGREDANYRGGGATMSMVLNGINKYGRFPVSVAGTYEESIRANKSINKNWRSVANEAERFQVGCSYLGNLSAREMADAVILCVKAGHPVAFGGSTAIANTPTYQNGIKQGVLKGSWAHATAFVAYREHRGVVYLAHMNSWGKIYGTGRDENDPASLVWISESDVRKMCAGNYSDAFVITYVESVPGLVDWNFNPRLISFPENAVR